MTKPQRIPKELLSVVPMWMCGSCGHVFNHKENTQLQCVLCGSKRVPPSQAATENSILRYFSGIAGIKYVALATAEERSRFAHQVLEPKLSPKLQAQLCIFFTTYLDSGWEDSGGSDPTDDGAWDDCNGTVTGSPVYDGSYACSFAVGEKGEMYSIGSINDCYMRFYVRTNDVTSTTTLAFMTDSNWAYYTKVQIGSSQWKLACEGATYTWGTPVVNTWYCVEFRRRNTANAAQLYIDGTLRIDQTPTVTNNTANINVGCIDSTGTPTVTIDAVVCADTYIGCLAGAETYTKTFTAGATIQKTYTKTFTVAARIIWQKLKTFTIGGTIIARHNKTFTAGATVQKTYTKNFTANARIVYQQLKTFTSGARVIWQKTKTFTASATIQKTYTKTFTVGATIRHQLSDQAYAIISSNRIPDKGDTMFTAVTGGNIKFQDYSAAKINSTRIWLSHVPWAHFGKIYKEAEEATLENGASADDLADDVLGCALLNAQNEAVHWDIDGLPAGRYVVLYRAKDTAQVASDFTVRVLNYSDTEYRNEEQEDVDLTLTADWAYYLLVFDVTAVDASGGDTHRVTALKNNADANSIYVDYMLIIPVSNGESWIQDVVDNSLRRVGQKFMLRKAS